MAETGMDIRLCEVDKGLTRDLVRIRKSRRVAYTVVDSFESWKVLEDSAETKVFGRDIRLDEVTAKIIEVLEADVFWGTFIRDGLEGYRFTLKRIEPYREGGYVLPLMREWENHILSYPDHYYGWQEVHELWDAGSVKQGK